MQRMLCICADSMEAVKISFATQPIEPLRHVAARLKVAPFRSRRGMVVKALAKPMNRVLAGYGR